MMRTSGDGLRVMRYFEKCRLKAYPDPKTGDAPWTCGWGSCGPDVGPGTVWTQAQADERFERLIAEEFEPAVRGALCVAVTQRQFDALVSITSNVGPGRPDRDGIMRLKNGQPSTLLRRLNAGDTAGASLAFLAWVSPGSNVEHGLRRRRIAERALFDGCEAAAAIAKGENA